MISEQQKAMDKKRADYLTRRTLLKRAAISLGLTNSITSLFLESCAPNTTPPNKSTRIDLQWMSEYDNTNTYLSLVDTFNGINKDGIHVHRINGPRDSGQQRKVIIDQLRAQQSSIDIFSLDVIWTDEFATNKWIVPLSDKYQWPGSERNNYLSVPLEAATFQKKVWAAPFRTDVGLLYYRNDIINTLPGTWTQLVNMAAQAQSSGQTKYGYVWQGAQYEGLICDFVEVLYSYGGSVLDAKDPTKVTVNSPAAVRALSEMVSWVGAISPSNITTYKEGGTLLTWENGNAAFMRNWPYAISLSSDANNQKVAGKFSVAPLPSGIPSIGGHSCIGGWQLGINAFSSKKKQDAAWKFIHWMLQEDAQQFAAINGSLTVTLQRMYSNPYVIEQNPFFKDLKPIFDQAILRPRSPRYQDISNAIQKRVYQALTKQYTPTDALKALQADLQQIISNQ